MQEMIQDIIGFGLTLLLACVLYLGITLIVKIRNKVKKWIN